MILIGLAGPPGAGKRTVAEYLLTQYGFVQPLAIIALLRMIEAGRNLSAPGIVYQPVRFYDDAFTIRRLGGQIWQLQRPGHLTQPGGEYHGVGVDAADRGIVNDGTIGALLVRVDLLIAELLERRAAKQAG